MNEKRDRLLQLIQGRPGLGMRDAARRIGLPQGVAAYHVDKLIEEGHITSARFGGRRLLFPYKAPEGASLAKHVLLEDPHLYAMWTWVFLHGPVAQQGILRQFHEEPRSTVQHRLDRLVRGGIIRTGTTGRHRIYEVVE